MDNYMDLENVIARHGRIAMQFSGGRDSLACLMLLRPYFHKVAVYHVDTGDQLPEVRSLVDSLRGEIQDFHIINGDSKTVRINFGLPSDLVPVSATPFGVAVGDGDLIVQDRYSCCYRTMMEPMHKRMIEDGITLIIRGQRKRDKLKSPVQSGDVLEGIEYFYPIDDWTDEQVNELLESTIGLPSFYEHLNSTPDCITCTAWWEEGRASYLKKFQPAAYDEYMAGMTRIVDHVMPHIEHFNKEVNSDGI